MKKIINWGIMGLGNAAMNLAQNFKDVPNARLIALASKTEKKRDLFYNKFKIDKKNIYNNYENLLNNENVDIVFIALPHTFHKEWCIKCASKHKNILVEKPATLTLVNLNEVINHVKLKKIFFTEGLAYMFHPFFNQINLELKKINIKNVISIKATFGNDAIGGKKIFGLRLKKPKKNKRLFNPDLAGGAIWDTGCYPISLVRKIISFVNDGIYIKPEILSSTKKIGSTGVDEYSTIQLRFNKIIANIETSIDRNLKNQIEIYLTEGKIIINNPWYPSNFSSIEIINDKEKKIIKCEKQVSAYQKEIEIISDQLSKNLKELEYPLSSYEDICSNIDILEKWNNGQ